VMTDIYVGVFLQKQMFFCAYDLGEQCENLACQEKQIFLHLVYYPVVIICRMVIGCLFGMLLFEV
jgi:hypothetical protein